MVPSQIDTKQALTLNFESSRKTLVDAIDIALGGTHARHNMNEIWNLANLFWTFVGRLTRHHHLVSTVPCQIGTIGHRLRFLKVFFFRSSDWNDHLGM